MLQDLFISFFYDAGGIYDWKSAGEDLKTIYRSLGIELALSYILAYNLKNLFVLGIVKALDDKKELSFYFKTSGVF